MPDQPGDRIDGPDSPGCLLGRHRLEPANPLTAREPELDHERVRHASLLPDAPVHSHDVLEPRGVDELLEARDLAVAHLPHVAGLGVEAPSRRLVDPGVATLENDGIPGIVKLPR